MARLKDASPAGAGTEASSRTDDTLEKQEDALIDKKMSKLDTCLLIAVACSAQLVAQLQVGGSIIPVAQFGRALGTENPGKWAWIPASYSLTAGIFVIVFGRMGDIYGPKLFFLVGYAINIIFNIAVGFVRTPIPFDILRALAGIGSAALSPNAVAILGRAFPPNSTERTVAFCIYGALAPIGSLLGGLFWSLLVELADWRWCFWTLACFCALMLALATRIIPRDTPAGGDMDWLGAALGLSGMILFNFCWNQAPLVGWSTIYVYVLLIVSVMLVAAFGYWQKKKGEKALLPARMFAKKEVPMVLLALVFGWMSFGIFLYYTVAFLRDVRGYEQPLSIVAQMSPLIPGGAAAALSLIYLMPRVKAHWIFAIAMLSFFAGDILVALAPVNQIYRAMIFPAMVLVNPGPDLSFASGQLIVSNAVLKEDQGSAAGIVLTLVSYSISIGLGMAGTVEVYVGDHGRDVELGIRSALYFGAGLAFAAFLIVALFVRIDSKPGGGH